MAYWQATHRNVASNCMEKSKSILITATQLFEKYYSRLWSWYGLPGQTLTEISVIKIALGHLFSRPIKVFEWGSGLSTIYYSEFLRKKGVDCKWYAVDNDRVWFQYLSSKVKSCGLNNKVFLNLLTFEPFWKKHGWDWSAKNISGFEPVLQQEIEYIQYPNEHFSEPLDVFFVDGRFRRRALLVAREKLASDGIVILHDSHRKHYSSSLHAYPFGLFFDGGPLFPGSKRRSQLWIGALNEAVLSRLKSFCSKYKMKAMESSELVLTK